MSQNFWYPPGSSTAGSITANQGTPNTDANGWPVKVTDGTDELAVNADGSINVTATVPGTVTVNQGTSPWVTSTTNGATEATLAAFSNKTAGSLVPEAFDEQVITYVGLTTDIATVTYKLATVTVATLTMTYDGSNRLINVVAT